MPDEEHEETPKNNLLKRGKEGESLVSTKKNSSKNRKNISDEGKRKSSNTDKVTKRKKPNPEQIKRNRENERLRCVKEREKISLLDKNPELQIGKKIYKNFDGVRYSGEVVSFKPGGKKKSLLWHVRYDSDDDSEDLSGRQFFDGLKLYARIEKKMIDLS
eukprot:CAMPEP_0198260540 /NCGR_PEP_ID=MMETSP1447-20131203/9499_1 /TAXON_ID=420782 /ORGANISM="Chaetoceros dichaeta, Strain CCMP1751" /LENGTH=159 /DNA_ID=CAMNT_0043948235 /DNA_START=410 /DNA_END=889 /DNA_ORIENTATION=+